MSNKTNFSGSVSASALTSNVGSNLASGIAAYRSALAAATATVDIGKINSLINCVINAVQAANIAAGQDQNAGIPPVSGATTPFNDATVSITADELDDPIQVAIDNAGAAGASAWASTTMSSTVKSYIQSGCGYTMAALAAYTSILGQSTGAGNPPTGGVKV